jgi:ankyrin repeat protein
VLGQNDYRPSLLSVAPLVLTGADLAYRHGPATPFLLAAFHGHLHVVKFLLNNGANPMDRSSCGKNALQLAAMRNHQEVVAWLGRHGFSLKDRDECGNSTVHLAALGGAKKVLAYLKAQGVPVAEINSDGMSPLHYAAMNGNKDVVSMLVAGGFDLPVDQRAYNGQTPVHRACLYGRCPAIGVLMQHGADLTARDARGANVVMLTALGCVCKYSPNNDVAHHAAMIGECWGKGVGGRWRVGTRTPSFCVTGGNAGAA